MKATFILTEQGLDFRLTAESEEEKKILPLLNKYKFKELFVHYNRDYYERESSADYLSITFKKPIEPLPAAEQVG